MVNIYYKSAIQVLITWEIISPITKWDIKYFSPSYLKLVLDNDKDLLIGFTYSETYIYGDNNILIGEKEPAKLIQSSLYSLQKDFIDYQLQENNIEELIQQEYDLNFFKSAKISLEEPLLNLFDSEDIDSNKYIKLKELIIRDCTSNEELTINIV